MQSKTVHLKSVSYPLLGRPHRLKEELTYSCDVVLDITIGDTLKSIHADVSYVSEGEYKRTRLWLADSQILLWEVLIEKLTICLSTYFQFNSPLQEDFKSRLTLLSLTHPAKLRFEDFALNLRFL